MYDWLKMKKTDVWRDETFISPNNILSVLHVSCVTAHFPPHAYTEGKREKSTLQNVLVERASNLGIYCKTLGWNWWYCRMWESPLPQGCLTPEYICSVRARSVSLHLVSLAQTGSPTKYWLNFLCLFLLADLYFLWWHWMILHLYPKATVLHAYHFHLK